MVETKRLPNSGELVGTCRNSGELVGIQRISEKVKATFNPELNSPEIP
jgi:hypothetical protein